VKSKEPAITPELIAEHGLKPDEYARIEKLIGRKPTFTELGIFSAMWNEHCSYKSSKVHLRTLPTKAPWVIQGPGENAGVIDIGDGLAAVFKMESHNHPSYIEPYQGAATGVGGILRDVFTMGARPIACLNALSFGDPKNPKTRSLVAGVVAGIGGYGNSFGVPTVGGEVRFDRRYDGNCLVNAMAVGIAEKDKIFYAAASGVGMPIVYLGSKTGRDGIHGASMASAEFDDDSDEKRPTVQVGDPFSEKLLLEACLEIMHKGCVIAIQDMGAAGLTSSATEMGAKGDLGVTLDLDKVPCREENMTAYEMMLSESQERMLMVLKPDKEKEAEAIFRKWGLDFAVVGETTPTRRFIVRHAGDVMADGFARLTEPAGLGAWLAARLAALWTQPDEQAVTCVLVSERGRWVAGFDTRGVLTGKRRAAAADLLGRALHPAQAPAAQGARTGKLEAPARAQPAVHELALTPQAARALLDLDDEPAADTTAFLALWGGADRSVCWGLVAPHARPRDPQAWRVALTRAGRELPCGALAALCRMTVREARSRRWLRLMDALRRTGKDSQDGRADDREL
jgi:selenophosphate synthetase-related protein